MTTDPSPHSDDDTHDIIDDALHRARGPPRRLARRRTYRHRPAGQSIDQAERCPPEYVCIAPRQRAQLAGQ
jgi:hypothetical protein